MGAVVSVSVSVAVSVSKMKWLPRQGRLLTKACRSPAREVADA